MKIKIDINKYYCRKIDKELIDWKNQKDNKSIALINGARRTGKTFSLAYLGQTQFDDYLIIEVQDLDDNSFDQLIDKNNRVINFSNFLMLKFNIDVRKLNANFLIIFDEIQERNELKESISVFNKAYGCRFACTGSALWIHDTNGTRPTDSFERFDVKPFSFREFLRIEGSDISQFEKENIDFKNNIYAKQTSRELAKLLRTYISVGGMPQAIEYFVSNKGKDDVFYQLSKLIYNKIIKIYEEDIIRYSNKFSIPLDKAYSNIIRNIGKIKNIENEFDSYNKLEKMNIVIYSSNLFEINNKLSLSIDENSIKPFLLDTGVLFYYYIDNNNPLIIQKMYESFINGSDSDNNGYIYENYLASSIVQSGLRPYFKTLTINGKTYELDFIFSSPDGNVLLESKSGQNKSHSSLDMGLTKYSKYIKKSYLLGKNYFLNKQNIRKGPHTIPFYAFSFLLEF